MPLRFSPKISFGISTEIPWWILPDIYPGIISKISPNILTCVYVCVLIVLRPIILTWILLRIQIIIFLKSSSKDFSTTSFEAIFRTFVTQLKQKTLKETHRNLQKDLYRNSPNDSAPNCPKNFFFKDLSKKSTGIPSKIPLENLFYIFFKNFLAGCDYDLLLCGKATSTPCSLSTLRMEAITVQLFTKIPPGISLIILPRFPPIFLLKFCQ